MSTPEKVTIRRQPEEERCWNCDDPTGRAGRSDDSLYDNQGDGPYCPECWETMDPRYHPDFCDDESVEEDACPTP